jgi:hypothetical protein
MVTSSFLEGGWSFVELVPYDFVVHALDAACSNCET